MPSCLGSLEKAVPDAFSGFARPIGIVRCDISPKPPSERSADAFVIRALGKYLAANFFAKLHLCAAAETVSYWTRSTSTPSYGQLSGLAEPKFDAMADMSIILTIASPLTSTKRPNPSVRSATICPKEAAAALISRIETTKS